MLLESGQEIAPRLCGLGVPLGVVDDLPVADGVDAVGDQQGHVLVGPYPSAFEIAAIDENLGVPRSVGRGGLERHELQSVGTLLTNMRRVCLN